MVKWQFVDMKPMMAGKIKLFLKIGLNKQANGDLKYQYNKVKIFFKLKQLFNIILLDQS